MSLIGPAATSGAMQNVQVYNLLHPFLTRQKERDCSFSNWIVLLFRSYLLLHPFRDVSLFRKLIQLSKKAYISEQM
jgi:hypothetical protein